MLHRLPLLPAKDVTAENSSFERSSFQGSEQFYHAVGRGRSNGWRREAIFKRSVGINPQRRAKQHCLSSTVTVVPDVAIGGLARKAGRRRSYVPEISAVAEKFGDGTHSFRFAIGEECNIPIEDGKATIVVAFSVITHLMDEEVFEYMAEARRVLADGGVAIFSFLDFNHAKQLQTFFKHARGHRLGHGDILKFTTTDVLKAFAQEVGFTSVEFLDGTAPIKSSGKGSKLVSKEDTPEAVRPGQSVCVMRV